MPNRQTKEEAYNRLLNSIEEELRDEKHEKISIYKGASYLNSPQGWCDYFPELNVYKGFCPVRLCRFCITLHTLMEYAAHADNGMSLKMSLVRAGHFNVATMGGGWISVSEEIKNAVILHFWDQYKALTG